MYPIIFSFGKVNIYSHGLLIALGAIGGGLVIYFLAKKENLSRRFLFDTLIYSLLGGIIGSRIIYVIAYYYQFANWKEFFYVWDGGFVSFGGIFFGFLTAGLILKKNKENILKWFDLGTIGLFFGWSIGRIGCLLTGDVVGVTSRSKIAIFGQIPVALFESIWCFIIACVLLYLLIWQKKFLSKFQEGFIFTVGSIAFLLGRFTIDFWRVDRILVFGLKAGQVTSLILIIFLTGFLYLKILKRGPSVPRSQNVGEDF